MCAQTSVAKILFFDFDERPGWEMQKLGGFEAEANVVHLGLIVSSVSGKST